MSEIQFTKRKLITSFIWKLLEKGGSQIIQFVVSIILARMLTPADYGVIALITVFINLANAFVQSGFGSALVQDKDSGDLEFSTIFYFSIFAAVVFYIILFFAAIPIAVFYNTPILVKVIRILGITLLFNSIFCIQGAYISKKLNFKKLFYASTFTMILSGAIGIFMAYKGFGIWALVGQNFSYSFLIFFISFIIIEWKPKLLFSFSKLKKLYSYSWKLLASNLIGTFCNNLQSLIIGKSYNTTKLGLYNRGQNFPQIISNTLDNSIQTVLFPTFSSRNDDFAFIKDKMRKSISLSAYILLPCIFGMAAVAKPMVFTLLSEKWKDCIIFLQIACIGYAFLPIQTANLTAINAVGRSDIYMKLEIIKRSLTIIMLIACAPFGIYALCIGQAVCNILFSFINAFPNKKLLNYHYHEQLDDLLPALIISLLMSASILGLNKMLNLSALITLVIDILFGAILYISLSALSRNKSFLFLVEIVIKKRKMEDE